VLAKAALFSTINTNQSQRCMLGCHQADTAFYRLRSQRYGKRLLVWGTEAEARKEGTGYYLEIRADFDDRLYATGRIFKAVYVQQ